MRHTFLALSLSLIATMASAQLLINEVMQSNIDCLMDDLNEFPDSWVELYNAGSSPVNLVDYSLGTDQTGTDRWALPRQSLAPGGSVIVYCDKEGKGLHTSFRLESGKNCSVYLFGRTGLVADRLVIAARQPAPNVSYGRINDGANTWGYQAEPTPGKPNCGKLCSQLLPDPVFSVPGQVFTGGRSVTLSLSLPADAPADARIHYTTDGSEPTIHSPLFVTPITFSTTRIIRAKAFCNGYLSPRSTTQSYLFLGRQMTLPVVSIVTHRDYFYDNKKGIYVNGTYSSSRRNYEYDWRRPINFEYFEAAQSPSILNQLCETRVQGGASRGSMYKSLAIYAHKRFGEKRFAHEFFPDQRPGVTDFKSLILRNAGNDFDYLYMRDAIIQRTMASHTDLDWQAWRPVIVFINGTYTGMLNIRERSNADNIYTHYDGLEDIDMIENWWDLKEGTADEFNDFTAFYKEPGHTWDEYAQRMDLEEYLNLMIMNLYYCNLDFPGNNIVMWRPRTEGGRWRFVAKDTDFGLGLYGRSSAYETLRWIYNPKHDRDADWANQSEHTLLFRQLIEEPRFRSEFIERCAIYMGTFMNHDGTWAVWEPMYQQIREEYPHHRKLINQWWPNYNDEMNNARRWLRERTDRFYGQLASFFQLGAPMPLRINQQLSAEERQSISVSMNGIELSDACFDGKFFAGREVTLEGSPAAGDDAVMPRTVTGWTVIINGRAAEYEGARCQFVMPNTSTVVIFAHLGQDAGIEAVQADATHSAGPIYDLMGRRVGHPQSGRMVVSGRSVR